MWRDKFDRSRSLIVIGDGAGFAIIRLPSLLFKIGRKPARKLTPLDRVGRSVRRGVVAVVSMMCRSFRRCCSTLRPALVR